MYLLDHEIKCDSRSDRIEIFPFYDLHIGKVNCAEDAIKKQIGEILKREKMKNRHVRIVFGGDNINSINPTDVRRFDFSELADWFVDSDAETTKERLSDVVNQEIEHFVEIFKPVRHLVLGALYGNHEKMLRTKNNVNAHQVLCDRMDILNLTDEAFIRIHSTFGEAVKTQTIKIYIRHGYGGGRTAGAEPNKIDRLVAEWEDADVSLTGHTHTFCISPPKPVHYVPNKGKMPKRMFTRYRFGANCGCWLLSHSPGPGSYESSACYPTRPMMTLKIVIWPFWMTRLDGQQMNRPKIELRQYPIL